MPCKAASTVFAGQTMQSPTVHPPAAAARKRNTNISAHSKGNSNPKTLGVQKCPKRRNRQKIEQIPTLYLCRGQQSGSRHMVCYMATCFPISFDNRKILGFLTTKVIWQGSTTTSSPPRLHGLCKFVSVRCVNSRKNSFHQLAHRVHRGKERRQCDIFCSPTTKTTKIHWKLSLFAHIPFCSQHILQLWYGKGILQQNECLMWVQHLQLW